MNRFAGRGALVLAALFPFGLQATSFSLVSLRSDDTAPATYTDGSNQPAITADGRYVAFVADAPNLVTPDAAGAPYQVYIRDRVAGTTELVSVTPSGLPGNASSSLPSISDDGCKVAFTSFASDLVTGDSNAGQDVFVRDRCATPAATFLASVSSGSVQGNAASFEGRVAADGRKVVFVSNATNLATMPGAGDSCLFVRDLVTQATSAITAESGACIAASSPDLSRDAIRVVFWSRYVPGTSNVTNGVWQIYLYDFNAPATLRLALVSTDASGAPQGLGSEGASTITAPAISSDGGYVAFRSRGSGLASPDGGGISHVYVKEISTGTIVRASVSSAGALGNADSSGSGSGLRPGLSRFANTVTFVTNATNLATETGGFAPNVVAHNPRTRQTIGFSASRTLGGTPAIADRVELIAAYSAFALDPAFASRGIFVFSGLTAGMTSLVVHYYQSILRRAPDALGQAFWEGEATRVIGLGASVNEAFYAMAMSFFFSPEYTSLNRNDTGFVTDLYNTFFNRPPDQAGFDFWMVQIAGGMPREGVLVNFMFSPEFANFTTGIFGPALARGEVNVVMDFYRGLLSRLPDSAGFNFYAGQFRQAQCQGAGAVFTQVENISSGYLNSPEYSNRGRSNAQFMADVYNAFMRRGPDLAGINFYIGQLNTGGKTREQIRQEFKTSPEFNNRVNAILGESCLQ